MISVSCLSSFLYCQRKLYLEKVLGIKSEIPKEALVRGSIRHQVHEQISLASEELAKSVSEIDFEKILAAFTSKYMDILRKAVASNKNRLRDIGVPLSDFFSQTSPFIRLEAEYRAGRVFEFAKATGLTGEKLWENITPKTKPEYSVSSQSLGVRGIIDELEVYPGCFIPVELKTGKAPQEGVWPGHRVQAAAYALLLEEVFKTEVKSAIVRYLDQNESREIAINPFLRQEVKELIVKVNELLSAGQIPGFPENEAKCKACDFREFCFDEEELLRRATKTKDLNRT